MSGRVVAKAFVSGGQTEDLYAAVRHLVESIRRGVSVCIPAAVVSYDRMTHVAEVVPLVRNVVFDKNYNVKDVVGESFSVPVRFPCFGGSPGFVFDIPLFKGDRGVVFAPDVDTSFLRHKTERTSLQTGDRDFDEDFWFKVCKILTASDRNESMWKTFAPRRPPTLAKHKFEHGFFIPQSWSSFDVTRVFNSSALSGKGKKDRVAEQSRLGVTGVRESAVGVDELYIGETHSHVGNVDSMGNANGGEAVDGLASLTVGKGRVVAAVGSFANVRVENENMTNDADHGKPSVTLSAGKSQKEGNGDAQGTRVRMSLVGSVHNGQNSRIVLEAGTPGEQCACIVLETPHDGKHTNIKILAGNVRESSDGTRTVGNSGTEVYMRPGSFSIKSNGSRLELGEKDADGATLDGIRIMAGDTKIVSTRNTERIVCGSTKIWTDFEKKEINIEASSMKLPDVHKINEWTDGTSLGPMAFM